MSNFIEVNENTFINKDLISKVTVTNNAEDDTSKIIIYTATTKLFEGIYSFSSKKDLTYYHNIMNLFKEDKECLDDIS